MVSKPRDEGLKGKVTANRNLVSIKRVCEESCGRLDNFSWIFLMKLMGTRSSNSFTGVYRFRILMI